MRVSGQARADERREAGRRADFAAALDRVERRAEAGRAEAGKAAERVGQRLEAARGAESRGQGAVEGGDSPATPSPGAEAEGPARGAGPEGSAASGDVLVPATGAGGAQGVGPGGSGEVAPAGETGRATLAQAVRALPPVVEAFQASGRAALAIDFGGALGVELRQAPGGVELRLTAPDGLRVAARLELAGLCRTLAARGVAVVRAEVGGGRPGRGRW